MVKYTEQQLLEEAITRLGARLPKGWGIETTQYETTAGADLLLTVRGPQASYQSLIVEAKTRVAPKEIQTMLGSDLVRRLRALGGREILLVAPYLSPRSRELLTEEGINFLDLTGNVRVLLTSPGLFIETAGADRDPDSDARPSRGLRGAKVGSVVRVLVDALPPMTVSEIASASKVNAGYVTRVLENLENQGFVTRGPRGRVEKVSWEPLLRRRAQALDLLAPHNTKRFISRNGARDALDQLKTDPPDRTIVTESFAAYGYEHVTAPALFAVYTFAAQEIAKQLDLLPTSHGPDVVLIQPENNGVFYNYVEDDGLWWAAPSQIAIDCLSGNGRMPSEGEALIEWMRGNEDAWRKASSTDIRIPDWVE